MGLFALKFFLRSIGGLGALALLLGVTFPSTMGVNGATIISDPNARSFVNAVVSNLPDLGKSIQGSIGSSQSNSVDPGKFMDVQNTFQNITNSLKNAGLGR